MKKTFVVRGDVSKHRIAKKYIQVCLLQLKFKA